MYLSDNVRRGSGMLECVSVTSQSAVNLCPVKMDNPSSVPIVHNECHTVHAVKDIHNKLAMNEVVKSA